MAKVKNKNLLGRFDTYIQSVGVKPTAANKAAVEQINKELAAKKNAVKKPTKSK